MRRNQSDDLEAFTRDVPDSDTYNEKYADGNQLSRNKAHSAVINIADTARANQRETDKPITQFETKKKPHAHLLVTPQLTDRDETINFRTAYVFYDK